MLLKKSKNKKSILSRFLRLPRKIKFAIYAVVFAAIGTTIFIFAHASSTTYAPLGTYTDWYLSKPTYTSLSWDVTPVRTTANDLVYWSGWFQFDHGDGGYIGIQDHGTYNPTTGQQGKMALFSIWSSLGATSPGVTIDSTDGQSGYGGRILYNWSLNTTYKMSLVKWTRNVHGQQWLALIENMNTGQSNQIAVITVPLNWGDVQGNLENFTEQFSSPTGCTFQPSEATFTNFLGNGTEAGTETSNVGNGRWLDLDHFNACTNSYISAVPGGVEHHIGIPPPTPTNLTYTLEVTDPNGFQQSQFENHTYNLCNGKTATSDANGYLTFTVKTGTTFCVDYAGPNSWPWYHSSIINVVGGVLGGSSNIPPPPQPPPPPPKVTVSGTVSVNGQGQAGVVLATCATGNVATNSGGSYSFQVVTGTAFCVRPVAGVNKGWKGPGTNNNSEHRNDPTYEFQIAGTNCYHHCSGSPGTYDRPTDSGYDFRYTNTDANAIAASGSGLGYWIVSSNGGVFAYGDAVFHGSAFGKIGAGDSAVAIAARPDGAGYWVLSRAGGVFSYGAKYYGNTHGKTTSPAVGIASTSTGNGYWIVTKDGGIFAFGDAAYEKSAFGLTTVASGITGNGTNGYWVVDRNGAVFAFGSAAYYGNVYKKTSTAVGIAYDGVHHGYWIAAGDGGVFAIRDTFLGRAPSNIIEPVTGIASRPQGDGYWLVAHDGGVFALGKAPYFGGPN